MSKSDTSSITCNDSGCVKLKAPQSFVDILNKYPSMFDGTLGTLPRELELKVDPSVFPHVASTRVLPVHMQSIAKEKLDSLEAMDVIAKQDTPLDW